MILITLTSVWRLQQTVPILSVLELPTVAALGAYSFFVLGKDRRRRLKRIAHPVTWALTALLGVIAISAPAGEFFGNTISFLIHDYIKTFVMFVLIAASVRSMRDLELLAGAQLLGALLYVVIILRDFSIGTSGRLGELYYYDSNDLAMILSMTLPFAVYFLRPRAKAIWRLIALIALLLILVAVVRTGSRGGFLGIITVLIYLLFRFNAVSKQLRLAAVSAFAVGMLVVSSDQYWTMMGTLLNPTEDYNFAGNSDGGRVEIWKRGIGYAVKHPLFGVGAANFGYAEGTLGRAAELARAGINTKRRAPHNSFIMAAAELGFVGLVVFCTLLWRARTSIFESVVRSKLVRGAHPDEAAFGQALWGAMLAYLVCGFFLSQTFSPLLHVILGMTVGLTKIQSLVPRSHTGEATPPRLARA